MGNICGSEKQEESEYAKTIKKHRQENPELQNVYKNDIDENLKYTDKDFPADVSSLIKEENKPYTPENSSGFYSL